MPRWSLLCAVATFSTMALSGCADQGPGRRYVVFFTLGSAAVDPSADQVIHAAAAAARAYPTAPVTVAGFVAANGSLGAEQALAASRTDTVAATLRADGVDASRIATQPRPPSNEDPTVGARRVEITVGTAP